MENSPSRLVIVPADVPLIATEAPIIGSLSSEETTIPNMVLAFCAVVRPIPIIRKAMKNSNRFLINNNNLINSYFYITIIRMFILWLQAKKFGSIIVVEL